MTEENIRPQSLNFFKLEDNTMCHWAHQKLRSWLLCLLFPLTTHLIYLAKFTTENC